MSESATFTAKITAQDLASAKILQLRANIESTEKKMKVLAGTSGTSVQTIGALAASIRKMREEMELGGHNSWIGRYAHLSGEFRDHLKESGERVAQVGERLSSWMPAFEGLTALAGAGGLEAAFKISDETVEYFAELAKNAKTIGMSVGALQTYQGLATMIDVDPARFTSELQRMQRNISAAASGHNKILAEYFKELGIPLVEHGQVRPVEDIIKQLPEAYKHNPSRARTADFSAALAGRGGGVDIENMFRLPDEERESLLAKVRGATYSPSTEQQEHLESANQANKLFKMSVDSLEHEYGAIIATTLEPAKEWLTGFLNQYRDVLAKGAVVATPVGAGGSAYGAFRFGKWLTDLLRGRAGGSEGAGEAGAAGETPAGASSGAAAGAAESTAATGAAAGAAPAEMAPALAMPAGAETLGLGATLGLGGLVTAVATATGTIAYLGSEAARNGSEAMLQARARTQRVAADAYGQVPMDGYDESGSPLPLQLPPLTQYPFFRDDRGQRESMPPPEGHIVIELQNAPPGTTASVTQQSGVNIETRVDGDTGQAFYDHRATQ